MSTIPNLGAYGYVPKSPKTNFKLKKSKGKKEGSNMYLLYIAIGLLITSIIYFVISWFNKSRTEDVEQVQELENTPPVQQQPQINVLKSIPTEYQPFYRYVAEWGGYVLIGDLNRLGYQ